MRTISFLTVLVLLVAVSVSAEDMKGGYAGSWFQVPIGARATAMGSAYRTISNDGAGPLYNSAGLANLQHMLFGTSYRAMQQDRTLGYATFIVPIQGQSILGAHWLYAGSGSVEARDSDGYKLGHDISQENHQFAVVFAKRFERWLSVGINMSYLYSTMAEMDVNSIKIDLGTMIYINQLIDRESRDKFPIDDFRFAFTINDIAAEYRWNSELYNYRYTTDGVGTEQVDKVPLEFGMGLSGRLMDRRLLLATDVVMNNRQSMKFYAGSEYYLTKEFALRAGFADGSLTFGTGYLFKFGKQQLAIDYAFSTEKADEGSEHIFSFDVLF